MATEKFTQIKKRFLRVETFLFKWRKKFSELRNNFTNQEKFSNQITLTWSKSRKAGSKSRCRPFGFKLDTQSSNLSVQNSSLSSNFWYSYSPLCTMGLYWQQNTSFCSPRFYQHWAQYMLIMKAAKVLKLLPDNDLYFAAISVRVKRDFDRVSMISIV